MIGFAQYELYRDAMKLDKLYMHQDFQRQGYGARVLAHVRLGPQVRERPHARVVGDGGTGDHAVVVHHHAVADGRVDDAHEGVDLAGCADARPA